VYISKGSFSHSFHEKLICALEFIFTFVIYTIRGEQRFDCLFQLLSVINLCVFSRFFPSTKIQLRLFCNFLLSTLRFERFRTISANLFFTSDSKYATFPHNIILCSFLALKFDSASAICSFVFPELHLVQRF
jgi:hypothetical protein